MYSQGAKGGCHWMEKSLRHEGNNGVASLANMM